jgi:hypothetical protein
MSTHNYIIRITAEVHARYADDREAHTDADSIAMHIREEAGSIVDRVEVAEVRQDGEE